MLVYLRNSTLSVDHLSHSKTLCSTSSLQSQHRQFGDSALLWLKRYFRKYHHRTALGITKRLVDHAVYISIFLLWGIIRYVHLPCFSFSHFSCQLCSVLWQLLYQHHECFHSFYDLQSYWRYSWNDRRDSPVGTTYPQGQCSL